MGTTTNYDLPYPEVGDAANVSQYIRDLAEATDSALVASGETSYIPVWTGATTNPVIGNGSITGGYVDSDEWVNYWIEITMGSTTTYGSGSLSVSLPPVTEANHRWTADGSVRDAGSSITYPIFGERQSAGTLLLRTLPTTAGQEFRSLTATNMITLANTDVIFLSGSYKKA